MKLTFTYITLLLFTFFSCQNKETTPQPQEDQDMDVFKNAIHPLEDVEDLDVLLNEIGDARVVLLGEASHGTSEYYTWRAEISKRLIQEKGFKIIAVEGDWPDLFQLNQYIKGTGTKGETAEEVLGSLNRWPTWMWANEEVADFGDWLKTYNQNVEAGQNVGFYGLDVYSLWSSMEQVIKFLDETDAEAAQTARSAYECISGFGQDEWAYANATVNSDVDCSDGFASVLEIVRQKYQENKNEASLDAYQNALAVVNAEKYYVTAVRGNASSWNIRDNHMVETIDNLLNHYRDDAKIIVWEHNTHVGDARATDMANDGMVNVGQLSREKYGEQEVYIVGFGSYSGTVIAASRWEASIQEMKVPNAQPGSWEAMLHDIEPLNKIILLNELEGRETFMKPIGHRAIGVVYNPASEGGNYVPSVLPERYDAFIFIDETSALRPISNMQGRKTQSLNIGNINSFFAGNLVLD